MRVDLLFSFVLAFLFATTVSAQDSTSVFVALSSSSGFIIPHRPPLQRFAEVNPWGLQAEVSRLRTTSKAWSACQCYSQNGLVFSYFNFVSPEIGYSVSLAAFVEPKLIARKRYQLGLRAGAGTTYLSAIFNEQTNPDNLFFSTSLAGLLFVQLNNQVRIVENWKLRVSAAYYHISNGGFRQPNLGMNFPTISLGLEHTLKDVVVPIRAKDKRFDNTVGVYTSVFYNSRDTEDGSQNRFPAIGLQIGFMKPIARMNALGLALEGSYDRSLLERSRTNATITDPRILSLLAKHHLLFGNFDLSQALGTYLFERYRPEAQVFQRYGLDYRITPTLRLGFSLKTHGFVAEQMDVRVSAWF